MGAATDYLTTFFSFESSRIDFFIKNNRYLLASLVCLMSIFIVSVVEFINVKEKNSTIRLSTTLTIYLKNSKCFLTH